MRYTPPGPSKVFKGREARRQEQVQMRKVSFAACMPLLQVDNPPRCNKPVNASKQITVHTAPQALCIQLKRFTPWGRKLTHQLRYPSVLNLNDVMSNDQVRPGLTAFIPFSLRMVYSLLLHIDCMELSVTRGERLTRVIITPTSRLQKTLGAD